VLYTAGSRFLSGMPSSTSSRLTYIDWLRGLACVLMFQTHCYDAWLGGSARRSAFLIWSQIIGTMPAPLFLFLAGVSVALVMERSIKKGKPVEQIAGATIRRGGEILALGFLFRLQEFVIAWGWAPWSDLFRVDILNTIGVSIILLGVCNWLVLRRRPQTWRMVLVLAAAGCAGVISALTPELWTNWRPDWLPWPIESYINGVHNLRAPQAALFPIFPWAGFAFAGLAFGLILTSDWARRRGAMTFLAAAVAGTGLIYLSRWVEARGWHFFALRDYWHTSPVFFVLRVGLLLVIFATGYTWCRWGAGEWGFSPLAQLGKTSLLVYWVHLEFVYGRFSILPRRAVSIQTASWGLLTICLAMLLLSLARTKLKGRSGEIFGYLLRARKETPATGSD
jgi:uncharacterized membrane protein